MESIKEIKRINKIFIGKKTRCKKKLLKKKEVQKSNNRLRDSLLFENSTDFSSNNLMGLEEKSDTILKIPNLDEVKIPSFLNDINKYNDINRRIKNYYKSEKTLGSPELAKIYLIDIKNLYELKKKI